MIKSIQEDNILQLNRFKQFPPHPSYIAGFIDGDGCIFIRQIKDGFQSGFSISQSRTNILQILKYHFGGKITSSTARNNNLIDLMEEKYFYKYNKRNEYNLLIYSTEYRILLEYLKGSFIIKETQYKCLQDFYKLVNLPNKNEEKTLLYNICANNNIKCELNKNYLTRLNIEYISGLFDAEGCFYIDQKLKKIRITISQKNHPLILIEIQKFVGYGYVYNYNYVINKKDDCIKFIELIKPHLIVKYNQSNAIEQFLKTTHDNAKEEIYKFCNKEKHESEHFTDLNKNENGKDVYYETLRLQNIKSQFCKEIQLKQFYKEKSEKMKAEGNHNYGKIFSKETTKKMSTSIRDAKNGVSDEEILNVRNLIYEGYKNIEIQELFNLSRHTVSRIRNGNTVLRSEEKIERKPLTQVEINLSKRKILPEEIIIVIEKYIENWKPAKILDYLIQERSNKNIENTLTIDIIKNIKRNLKNDKNIIYESELTKERYEYYLNLRDKFNID